MSAPEPGRAAAGAAAAGWKPHAMLATAFFLLALNVIIGRAVHADIPPVALSFWRWLLATLIFLPFSFRRVRAQWPLLVEKWKLLLLMSVVLMLFGNTLVYVGLQSTTALNGGLIPVARPVIILILSSMLFRGTVTGHQWLGIAIALIGVLAVITRGDPAVLAALDVNVGDLWILASSCGIASYHVLVPRAHEKLHPMVVVQATMVLGVVLLAPVYLWEAAASGRTIALTPATVGAVLYVAVFPSICAMYLANAAIVALGAARTSIYHYLQPFFVALIAIPVLGEAVHWYHPLAFALVIAGILVANRARRGER